MKNHLNWAGLKNKSVGPPWFTLLTTYMGNLENLTVLVPEWLDLKLRKMTNPFWNTVFQSWIHFWRKNTPQEVLDVVYSVIWYNNQISNELFLPKLYKNGIHVEGEIFTKDHLQKLFDIDSLDFDYYNVKSFIQKFKKKVKFEKPIYFHRLYIPAHVRILFNQVKVAEFSTNNILRIYTKLTL